MIHSGATVRDFSPGFPFNQKYFSLKKNGSGEYFPLTKIFNQERKANYHAFGNNVKVKCQNGLKFNGKNSYCRKHNLKSK